MLPPDLVAKLNECANTNFAVTRDLWVFRQSIASWFVIGGLVLEGPELLYEIASIVQNRVPRFRRGIVLADRIDFAKIAAFVGWIFIIVGLLGELKASSRIVDLSASIQECSDAKVREATLEAGEAKLSAEGAAKAAEEAKASAAVVGQQADILKDEVRRLIFLGPRDLLLLESTKPFDALKKFPAQQFRFSVCKGDIPTGGTGDVLETEVGKTLRAILAQLRRAGWKSVSADPLFSHTPAPLPYFNKTCGSALVVVDISEHPTRRTKEAAIVLQSVLNHVLLQGARLGSQKELSPDPGPGVIDVHVGSHPAYPAATYKLQNEER
jgi:hypothetical protein